MLSDINNGNDALLVGYYIIIIIIIIGHWLKASSSPDQQRGHTTKDTWWRDLSDLIMMLTRIEWEQEILNMEDQWLSS